MLSVVARLVNLARWQCEAMFCDCDSSWASSLLFFLQEDVFHTDEEKPNFITFQSYYVLQIYVKNQEYIRFSVKGRVQTVPKN